MSTENSSERSWSTQYEFTERCVRVLWEFFDLAYREIQKICFFLHHIHIIFCEAISPGASTNPKVWAKCVDVANAYVKMI